MRTLGEVALILFVMRSLKDSSREAYEALYELHGYYEVLSIFGKMGFKKHLNGDVGKLFTEKIEQLEMVVFQEFRESEQEVFDKVKMKNFVITKLSKSLYKDATTVLDRYIELPFIKIMVNKLLKESGKFQFESLFVHARFLSSSIFNHEDEKIRSENMIVKDVLERVHLALSVYFIDTDDSENLMQELSELKNQLS